MNRRRWQRARVADSLRCRKCLTKRAAHGHHVVYEAELESRGLPKYDKRNMMALCADCHFNHHHGPYTNMIPLALLSDENVAYAYEVLGSYAFDYLREKYAGDDERVRLDAA